MYRVLDLYKEENHAKSMIVNFLLKINIKMRREKGISIKDKLYNYIGIKIAEKFFLSWS